MKQLKKRKLIKFLILGITVHLGLCAVLAVSTIFPPREKQDGQKGSKLVLIPGAQYPVAAFVSSNFYAAKPVSKVAVLVHGLGGNAGEWNQIAETLNSKGIATISIHVKGHGLSKSDGISFGRLEKDEVTFAVRWARKQTSSMAQVVVVGRSMGASSTWLSASEHPDEIDAIVSESCFTDLRVTSNQWLSQTIPLGNIVFAPTKWIGAGLARANPNKIVPIKAAAVWTGKPTLIIHAENDSIVTRKEADEFVAQTGGELWVVKGSEHAQVSVDEPEEYAKRIISMFRK